MSRFASGRGPASVNNSVLNCW